MHDNVVQVSQHGRCRRTTLGLLLLGGLLRLRLLVAKVGDGTVRSSQGHAQRRGSSSNDEELGDVQLKLGHAAALDGRKGLLDGGLDGDEAFGVDGAHPLYHALADDGLSVVRLVVGRSADDALDGPVALLAQLDKGHLGALHARVLQPCPDDDRLSKVGLADVLEVDVLSAGREGREQGRSGSAVEVLGGVFLGLVGGCGNGDSLGSSLGLESFLLGLGLGLLGGLLRGAGSVGSGGGGGIVARGRGGGVRFFGHCELRVVEKWVVESLLVSYHERGVGVYGMMIFWRGSG